MHAPPRNLKFTIGMNAVIGLLAVAPAAFGQKCPADTPSAPAFGTGLCEHKLALEEYAAGHSEQAETHYLRALSAWERAGEQYAAAHVATLIGLGRLYQATERPREAIEALTRGLELARPIEANEPKLTAVALSRIGGVYSTWGNVEQARSALEQAIGKLRALPIADLPELAYAYNSLGMTDLRALSYASGESNLRQAVSIATESLGEKDQQTAIYETNLGLALYLEGQYSRSLPLLRRGEFLLESKPDEYAQQLGSALAELSVVEVAMGKFALAENDGARALNVLSRHFRSCSPEVARAQVNLAAIYLVQHKTREAAELLPEAVATERHHAGGRALANGIRWLAQLRAQQRQWGQAESLYREAIGMYEAEAAPAGAEIEPVKREYAAMLKQERGKSRLPAT